MNFAVKPPYTVAAITSGAEVDPDDLFVINAVDDLMRSLRMHELAVGMSEEHRNELLEKHVNSAFEYYSGFTKADMAKMLLIESLMKEGGVETDE